ncbi:MAG: tryptophan-rich sensory protein [Candidatus Pacebacteria bacterium]|nr:tryptophan-rich sensory protein [Candidatus Paceibacterota bacterium]
MNIINKNNLHRLILSVILAQGAGVIGSCFTAQSLSVWYAGLLKPVFMPPSEVFGPVWFLLYLAMGFSFFLIWERGLKEARNRWVFYLFLVHLGVNILWSLVFFGMQELFLSIIVIVILWLMIAALIAFSWHIDRWAALLLIPYLLWVSFATVLNVSIWQLNDGPGAPHSRVPIEAEYQTHIVYTSDVGLDKEPFRSDCRARSGVFQSCGSPCDTSAEVCIAACAFTCELLE